MRKNFLSPFKWFCIETFPFIEDTFDSLTEYQLLCKIIEYLNKIGLQTEEITEYFNNLDVQDEINNKLNEMAEDGTLQEIMAQYLNTKACFCFDNITEMKQARNLLNGSFAKTYGFYSINDGGNAFYKIRNITNDDVVDNMFIIAMNNPSLVAELIIDKDIVNIKQLGARPLLADNVKRDIKPYILSYINKNKGNLKLYIPSGFWYCSETKIESLYGFEIYGDYAFEQFTDLLDIKGTIICSLNNNQNYIFDLNSTLGKNHNFKLDNIMFTTYDIEYNNTLNKWEKVLLKNINGACLNLQNCYFAKIGYLAFIYVYGTPLNIGSSWEIDFETLNFRYINNYNGSIINFKRKITNNDNITALNFRYLLFERTLGNLINCEQGCELGNCNIGTLNFEDNIIYEESSAYTQYNDNNQDTSIQEFSVFNVEGYGSLDITIVSIILNNFARHFYTENNVNYAYNNIINLENNAILRNIIDNIHLIGLNKDINIVKTTPYNNINNSLFINNVMLINTKHQGIFNLKAFPEFNCNNISNGYDNTNFAENNLWQPFYKTIRKSNTQSGKIYYNSLSRNKLKCVTNLSNNNNDLDSFYLYTSSDNIKIRAVIPQGYNAVINLKVGSYEGQFTLEGTGSFKIYDIPNIHEIIGYPTASGMEFQPLTIAKVDAPQNSYFDLYKFY